MCVFVGGGGGGGEASITNSMIQCRKLMLVDFGSLKPMSSVP